MSDDNSTDRVEALFYVSLGIYFVGLLSIYHEEGGLRWWYPIVGIPVSILAALLLIPGIWLYETLQTLAGLVLASTGVAALSILVMLQLIEHHHDPWLITVGSFDLLWAMLSRFKTRRAGGPIWAINTITTLLTGLLLIVTGIIRSFVLTPAG